jgi:hypothetical protein
MRRPRPELKLCWLLLLTPALFACPSVSTTDGGSFLVGPDGTGTTIVVDTMYGVGISVPKGALDEETLISITLIDTGIPEVPMRKRISYGYRLSPSTLKFNAPIKLYLPWVEDRLVNGVDPGTFDMRRQTTMDPYLALPGTQTITQAKSVEAQTDRLGLFWLTSPQNANVATLTLEPEEVTLNVGDTQQFRAEVKDPTGTPIAVDLRWSAVAPRIGTITEGNDGGLYTAKDPGIATVTVRAGSQSAQATVRVRGSTPGPSTFVHENPFPTGNDLWGGTVGPIGTAFVGANGTVLVRQANGTYTRAFSSPGLTLKGIAGTSLQNAVAVGSFGTNGVLVELSNMQPKVSTFMSANPQHLWFDGTYGMAVGTGNDVIVRRGNAWVREYNPSFEPLLSVVGDGAGSFVVLGGQGSIYKYDPMTMRWNSLFQTQLAVLLTAGALTNASGTEAWACGGNKLWHFQNDLWTSINLPATPFLTEATALGLVDGKIVIGGRVNRTGYALVFDAAAMPSADGGVPGDGGMTPEVGWTVVPMRGPQIPRGFFGQGTASQVGWLVGDYGSVWRYESGTLVEESRGFYGDVSVVVAAGTDLIAAANECANSSCTAFTPQVYQRDAAGVFTLVGGSQPFGGRVWAMAARSKNDVVVSVAAADGSAPSVWFYNGNSWSPAVVTGGLGGVILALKYCGTTLYGAGANGMWYRGGPTQLTRQPALGMDHLWALDCPVDNEQWLGGDGVLFSRVGSGSFGARDSMAVSHAPYRAVWSPGPGEAFAFGDASFGTYWNTQDLVLIQGPGGTQPDVINGLWGSSPDNLYAVGLTQLPVPFGLGIRFDGADWRLVDMGSQRAVNSIHGTTNTNVFIGTRGGGVLRGVPPP